MYLYRVLRTSSIWLSHKLKDATNRYYYLLARVRFAEPEAHARLVELVILVTAPNMPLSIRTPGPAILGTFLLVLSTLNMKGAPFLYNNQRASKPIHLEDLS